MSDAIFGDEMDDDYDEQMAEEMAAQRRWDEYWNGLSDEDRRRERESMAAYAAEHRDDPA